MSRRATLLEALVLGIQIRILKLQCFFLARENTKLRAQFYREHGYAYEGHDERAEKKERSRFDHLLVGSNA